ncbi:MAG: 4Fe-4S binding protein, partial [Methanomassiliicoccales archaeon]|nr:4Fe-4S binding protein [Methanomassiliicoccales archaeon]
MSGEIGVFVCSFAGGSKGNLDTDGLAEFARSLPGVAWSRTIDELCKDSARSEIISSLKEGNVDRFVVAACSPMVQERRLMSLAAESGLNPFMFTVANVREQSALVHSGEEAQKKAAMLLSMAVAKCALLAPAPYDVRIPERRSVIVLGDGMRAVLSIGALVERGLDATLISPAMPLRLPPFMDEALAIRLRSVEKTRTLTGEAIEVDGAPGAFEVLVEGEDAVGVRCGAILVAFDTEDSIELADGMVGSKDLEELLDTGRVPSSAAIIAGNWDPEAQTPPLDMAMNAASRMRAARGDCVITIVARDIVAKGTLEGRQLEAQRSGVRFVRSEDVPIIALGPIPKVIVTDQVLGTLTLSASLIVDLRSGRNEASARACQVLGIATRPDGTPREAKVRLAAGESLKAGVFVFDPWTEWCSGDVVLDAEAIASRIAELLGSGIEEGGPVAQVEEGKCSACLTCVRICPYGAPRMNDEMKASIRF